MIYSVKLRCVGGKSGAQTVTYSTFQIDAADEADAVRLATIKARQRYFGENPQVRVVRISAESENVRLETAGTNHRRILTTAGKPA